MFKEQRTNNSIHQTGFTLLELLVVVSILAAVSGIGFFALRSDALQEKYVDLAKVEMQNIAKAVKRFKVDTGYYPGHGPFALLSRQGVAVGNYSCATDVSTPSGSGVPCESGSCNSAGAVSPLSAGVFSEAVNADDRILDMWHISPINMSQLLTKPEFCFDHPLAYLAEWDAVTGKGWNGPYLSREGYVDIDCRLSESDSDIRGVNADFGHPDALDGSLVDNCNFTDSSGASRFVSGYLHNVPALADTFVPKNVRALDRGGILHWRNKSVVSTDISNNKSELGRIGQPYLLFYRKQFVTSLGLPHPPPPTLALEPVVRLVSAGPDGVYGGVKVAVGSTVATAGDVYITQEDWCSPNSADSAGIDDIVLCF